MLLSNKQTPWSDFSQVENRPWRSHRVTLGGTFFFFFLILDVTTHFHAFQRDFVICTDMCLGDVCGACARIGTLLNTLSASYKGK